MALSRRTGQRFQANIWPGFVDAMTGLLLVLMFVLTIFMVVQFVLRETITGQESELDTLNQEIAALADALGLETRRAGALEARVGELSTTIESAEARLAEQAGLIASLTAERDAQAERLNTAAATIAGLRGEKADAEAALGAAEAKITDFEAEVAALLLAKRDAETALGAAEAQAADLAKQREALDAIIARAEANAAERGAELESLKAQLSQEEAARLVAVEAAEALREKLASSDSELTAMTLALEKARAEAEETLTLLAAAQAAEKDLDTRLAAALLLAEEGAAATEALKAEKAKLEEAYAALQGGDDARAAEEARLRAALAAALAAKLAAEQANQEQMSAAEQRAALLASAREALSKQEAISAEAQKTQALLNRQVAALRGQLGELQALLDDYKEREAASDVQVANLGKDLNAALARAAAEERKRRLLEEADRKRLEAEKQNLEKYRSEFFGRLRDVLGAQDGVRIVGDRFVFSSEVLFPPGAATLSREGQGEISKVANILRRVAADIPDGIDWVIRVDGHTDNTPLSGFGEFADNWELSQARALSVVRYMVNFLGIPPERLSANGFGQYQPVAAGNSEAARAANRRIELKFTEK